MCEIIIENGDVCCNPRPSLRVFAEFARGREGVLTRGHQSSTILHVNRQVHLYTDATLVGDAGNVRDSTASDATGVS